MIRAMSEGQIVRCPHCGTDFTPSHLAAEIERLTAFVQYVANMDPDDHAPVERAKDTQERR